MKAICHVTSAHTRYDVRIFEKECISLANNGYIVYLIVNDDKENEIKNGVEIRSTGFKPSGRRERMFSSMKYILAEIEKIDADIYHFHDPELLQLVGKLSDDKRKIVFDAHEDTEVQIMDKQWIPYCFRRLISKAYAGYTKKIFKKCSGIITVTPAIVKKMSKYNKNVEMVTNYPIIYEEGNISKGRQEQYVFFAGGVSRQWCHERIIQAVAQLEGIQYKIAGPIDSEYLEELKKIHGWEKTDYIGKIPHNEVKRLYSNAIAGMAINECSQIRGEGTLGNTKLFEIMEASVPVICTNYKLWKDVVEGNSCGVCVDSQDINQIAEAIERIRSNQQQAEEMGINGRMAIEEKYNWGCEEKKLLDFYSKILVL